MKYIFLILSLCVLVTPQISTALYQGSTCSPATGIIQANIFSSSCTTSTVCLFAQSLNTSTSQYCGTSVTDTSLVGPSYWRTATYTGSSCSGTPTISTFFKLNTCNTLTKQMYTCTSTTYTLTSYSDSACKVPVSTTPAPQQPCACGNGICAQIICSTNTGNSFILQSFIVLFVLILN